MLGVELEKEYAGLGEGLQREFIGKGYLVDFHQSSRTFRFFPPYVITPRRDRLLRRRLRGNPFILQAWCTYRL